jgi:hypothetical protein
MEKAREIARELCKRAAVGLPDGLEEVAVQNDLWTPEGLAAARAAYDQKPPSWLQRLFSFGRDPLEDFAEEQAAEFGHYRKHYSERFARGGDMYKYRKVTPEALLAAARRRRGDENYDA